jgi:hypothetical protein
MTQISETGGSPQTDREKDITVTWNSEGKTVKMVIQRDGKLELRRVVSGKDFRDLFEKINDIVKKLGDLCKDIPKQPQEFAVSIGKFKEQRDALKVIAEKMEEYLPKENGDQTQSNKVNKDA